MSAKRAVPATALLCFLHFSSRFRAVLLSAVVTSFLGGAQALSQMAPVPPDPSELVRGLAEPITNGHQRSAAIDLLERARWNYNLHGDGGAPYTMKVSFTSSGQAALEGSGTMEETWIGHSSWKWGAAFAGTTQARLGKSGEVYGTNDPVPMRVQTVRSALFWPIMLRPSNWTIRSAKVKYAGGKVTCLLLSGAVSPGAEPRFWVETEYCIDPASGLLQMWSEAPGVYTTYEYANAINFHGHMIPRKISVSENGTMALEIRVESVEDAVNVDPNALEPTPEVIAQGPSFTLALPGRFPMVVDPDPAGPAWIQPVIVHAIIGDNDGQVLDAEALQTSDRQLADAAVDLVKTSSFPATGMQREVFVNVQFHRPEAYSSAIFVERVRRVVLVRREKLSRPPRRPRGPIPRGRFAEDAGDHF
jgi:hypothetical protein